MHDEKRQIQVLAVPTPSTVEPAHSESRNLKKNSQPVKGWREKLRLVVLIALTVLVVGVILVGCVGAILNASR